MKTLFHFISYVQSFKLIIIILFFCVSCSMSYEKAIVSRVERNLGDCLAPYDEIVIIPGAGCTGCISNAERYFLKNVSNNKKLFVFTYNISQKSLFMRLGRENLIRENVIIDIDDRFYVSHHHDNIYPYIIIIDDGRIIAVKEL